MTEPVQDTAVTRPRKSDLVPGYTLNVLLGKGGMGEVYKATQLSLRRTVALKLLSTELAKDQVFIARFEKEAAALGALSHPNIVTVVDKGCAEGTYFLVMEYVDGASLREVMRQPTTGLPTKLRTIYDVCRGME
ncbi:MAG TPA: protein kinase, partial [Gemmatimonadales bacterium]|nr:protein kinase [Gemmatimonadales bacterium]